MVLVLKKRKRSEPGVGPRRFNPLARERLSSHIYGTTKYGKSPGAKEELTLPAVEKRMKHAAHVSRAEAEQVWKEICKTNP